MFQSVFAQSVERRVFERHCAFEDCLNGDFKEVMKLTRNGKQIIRNLVKKYQTKIGQLKLIRPRNGLEGGVKINAMLIEIDRFIKLCKDLGLGLDTKRHVIIVGQHFYNDGKNNYLAARTHAQDLKRIHCGKLKKDSDEYKKCIASIIILEQPTKEDLKFYFDVLGEGAIQSLSYYGHGLEDSVILSGKNMLLPSKWHPGLKISNKRWSDEMLGSLYADDLRPIKGQKEQKETMSYLWKKAMDERGQIDFYACNTAKTFCPVVAKVTECKVGGCNTGMSFEYKEGENGKWKSPGEKPVPNKDNVKARMVIPTFWGFSKGVYSRQTIFGGKVKPFEVEQPSKEGLTKFKKHYRKEDVLVNTVVLRLAAESGDRALVNKGKEMVIISKFEARRIRELFKDYLDGIEF